jgi:hypothetical protein
MDIYGGQLQLQSEPFLYTYLQYPTLYLKLAKSIEGGHVDGQRPFEGGQG